MYNVEGYKKALDSGDRVAILAFALNEMTVGGITPNPVLPVTETTTAKATGYFNNNALLLTKLFDDGNAGKSDKALLANAIAQSYGEMELADAQLREIDRIAKGDKFGGGRGFDTVGEPPYVARLEKKLDQILASIARPE
jgi:hypothetical protein